MASFTEATVLGRILISWAFVPVVLLIAIKSIDKLLKSPELVDVRIWAGMQFRNCFVLPNVKPLGKRGKFFLSWYIRIVADLAGLAAWIRALLLVLEVSSPSAQMSSKLCFVFCCLVATYFLLGCGLRVLGRKEQIRINGGGHRVPLDVSK